MRHNFGQLKYFMVHADKELCFAVCRGPEAFFNHLSELIGITHGMKNANRLVIDQILVTGDNEQRFVEAPLRNGNFAACDLTPVNGTRCLRGLASIVFRENTCWEASSILTSEQLARIQSGLPL